MSIQVDYPRDPETFKVIDGMWFFDKETYEDLGCDFSPLENPAEDSPISILRRSAAIYTIAESRDGVTEAQIARAGSNLEVARSAVYRLGHTLLRPAIDASRSGELDDDHPAIAAFKERAEIDIPIQRRYQSGFRSIELVWFELYRDIDSALFLDDKDRPQGKFTDIFPPNSGGSPSAYSAKLTADQLVYARPGYGWGL